MSLGYSVRTPASHEQRAHLRFILSDISNCEERENQEKYYAFFYMLANAVWSSSVHVALQGDTDDSSPFWLTGWSGSIGNRVLDPSSIKGFILELSLDSQGEVGSTVEGAISIGNLTADFGSGIPPPSGEDDSVFKLVQFESDCCGRCTAEEDCMYAFSTKDRQCYLASYLAPDAIKLERSDQSRKDVTFYRKNDAFSLGDFCSLCDCRQEDLTIDCTGRVVPTTFSLSGKQWQPRVLDLRNNPRLHRGILGDKPQHIYIHVGSVCYY
jgi:hypothetical protein